MALWKIFILVLMIKLTATLKINSIWTPDVIENGTQLSAIVDCDFTYNEEDKKSFELKWYFRFDPTPIYTWVPPNDPQVHPSFVNYINPRYEVSSDPYFKYRALKLQRISTALSGRYSCRVSSIYEDDFQSRNLIVYAPPKKSALDVGWINPKILNVTCQAIDIYPEPQLNIRITTHQSFSDDPMDSKVWKEGSFSVSKSLLIENLTVGTVTCEISLPGTSYREVRRRKVPNVPIEFIYSSSGGSTFSNNFQQCIVNCVNLIIFTRYFTQIYMLY